MSKEEFKPVKMVKGDAHTPQRFWIYAIAFNAEYEQELIELGYVKSNEERTQPKEPTK